MSGAPWATRPILDLNDYIKGTAWSDAYHDSPNAHTHECCIACGRRTVAPRGITVVLGTGGSGLIHPDDNDAAAAHDPGYMGSWMVGPECGRAIPKAYRVNSGGDQ
jgi:hypothetical protein